jgi:hypothetical protein
MIYTVKLKNGTDLLGEFVNYDGKVITLKDPIQVFSGLDGSPVGKKYNALMEGDYVCINRSDAIFLGKASQVGVLWYETFIEMYEEKSNSDVRDEEDLFDELIGKPNLIN